MRDVQRNGSLLVSDIHAGRKSDDSGTMSILSKLVSYGNDRELEQLCIVGDQFDKAASKPVLKERGKQLQAIYANFRGKVTLIKGNHEESIELKHGPMEQFVGSDIRIEKGVAMVNGAVAYHGHRFRAIKVEIRQRLRAIIEDFYRLSRPDRDFLFSRAIQNVLVTQWNELGLPADARMEMPKPLLNLLHGLPKYIPDTVPNVKYEQKSWLTASGIWSHLAPLLGQRISITGHTHQPGMHTYRYFQERGMSMPVVSVDCGSFVNGGTPITAVTVQGSTITQIEYDTKDQVFHPSHTLQLSRQPRIPSPDSE